MTLAHTFALSRRYACRFLCIITLALAISWPAQAQEAAETSSPDLNSFTETQEQSKLERLQYIKPMGGGSNWYGFGVHMKPRLATDGYPSELFHRGGHDGFTSYFNIDRELRNGVLTFINGRGKANRDKLRTAIVDAFMDHYRS